MNRLALLQQVVEQVPPYVWRDYAGVDPRRSRADRLQAALGSPGPGDP